jgi:hypothetical protein
VGESLAAGMKWKRLPPPGESGAGPQVRISWSTLVGALPSISAQLPLFSVASHA